MEIRNLEHTGFDTLFCAFERAFADYEIHFEKKEVRSMLQRRGYNPKLSFAAFVNDDIAAFTLNGIGTVKEYWPEQSLPILYHFFEKQAFTSTCLDMRRSRNSLAAHRKQSD